MKYLMNQKWFALGDDFVINDERGREAYRVDGATFAFDKNLTFYDRRDSELAYVSRKMPAAGLVYEIYHGDDLQAIVRKELFSLPQCRLGLEARSPDDLHAEGNLGGREYSFKREGKPVGRVSKSYFHRSDTYGIEVGRGEDDLLLLAAAIVVDLCCQPGHVAAAHKLACSQ